MKSLLPAKKSTNNSFGYRIDFNKETVKNIKTAVQTSPVRQFSLIHLWFLSLRRPPPVPVVGVHVHILLPLFLARDHNQRQGFLMFFLIENLHQDFILFPYKSWTYFVGVLSEVFQLLNANVNGFHF